MGLLHASILTATGSAKIEGACERSFALRRFLPRLFKGAHVVSDLSGFAGLDLDAVYITTPIPSHFTIASQVYKMGIAKNVFIEKTLTSDSRASASLAEASLRSGGVSMVGYNRRFSTTFRKAKSLLEEGAIGEPVKFDAYAYSSDFLGESLGVGNRGGVLRDLGSHSIDAAIWFFGALEVVRGSVRSMGGEVEFAASSAKGVEGSFHASWSRKGYRLPEIGIRISGSKGSLVVDDDAVRLSAEGKETEWFRPSLSDNVPFLLGGPEYYREDASFIEAVQGAGESQVDFRSAAATDSIIDEVVAGP